SRSPLQLGAELYGEPGLEADVEVIDLMLSMFAEVGIEADENLTLDLGHGDIVRYVLHHYAGDKPGLQSKLFDAVQRKSRPDLDALVAELDDDGARAVSALLELHGDLAVLDRAEALFADDAPAVVRAIDDLRRLAATLMRRYPSVSVYFDLTELRGYHYHTGVVFAVYARG
ncbi:unnamed protein product, partial [Ectocarpus sp. 12 AP-2014]